jgi:hypothetical protein
MARTAEIIRAFDHMLDTVGGNVRHVVFDLDATLGDDPGWHSDNQSLHQYVHYPKEFTELLRYLRSKHGIRSTLVSRNGSFCGNLYNQNAAQAKKLGFNKVVPCSRLTPNKPKPAFLDDVPPAQMLLIDDQPVECAMAANHGSKAVLCNNDPIFKTLLNHPTYNIYQPAGCSQKRKRRGTRARRPKLI